MAEKEEASLETVSLGASNSQAQKTRGSGIEKQMFIKQSFLEVDTEKRRMRFKYFKPFVLLLEINDRAAKRFQATLLPVTSSNAGLIYS